MMKSVRKMLWALTALAALAANTACAPAEKPAEGSEDVAAFAVGAIPDGAHQTFIDLGGKMHIVGYEVSPEGTAGPSQSVGLKLYWQRVGALEPGWDPFTHLENDLGAQIGNLDRLGDFRGKVAGQPGGLALLEFGKIYKDEQTLELPKATELTPRISLLVGVYNKKVYDETNPKENVRLPVVSGSTNGHDAALVAEFSTGVERQRPVALKGSRP